MLAGTLTGGTQAAHHASMDSNMQKPSVLVVGAGLIGSSVAMHLARQGCKVTVVEASQPASGASGKSWAWLNANRKKPAHYRDLNFESMKLWQQYPDLAVFPGSLLLEDNRPDDATYPSTPLSPEQLAAEEPALSSEACRKGARLHQPEGYGYPEEAVNFFLEEAKSHGASVVCSQPVQKLQAASGKVTGIRTSVKQYEADVVVLAAALGIPELAEQLQLQVPLTVKPRTVTVITKPLRQFLKHIVVTDTLFIVQRRDGDVMISPFAGPDRPEEATQEVAQQTIKAAAEVVPQLADAEVQQITAGVMPYPADAHPITGFAEGCSNLYIAVMHSGATLAPMVGKLVAEEIVSGQRLDVLAPYRLERDFSDLSHVY